MVLNRNFFKKKFYLCNLLFFIWSSSWKIRQHKECEWKTCFYCNPVLTCFWSTPSRKCVVLVLLNSVNLTSFIWCWHSKQPHACDRGGVCSLWGLFDCSAMVLHYEVTLFLRNPISLRFMFFLFLYFSCQLLAGTLAWPLNLLSGTFLWWAQVC